MHKITLYQVFTRLFGNTSTANVPWGTREQNGVGKFSDFTPRALEAIRDLGISHIWYTGVPHHARVTDDSQCGIRSDHPSIVKGRAGSPYAVKDYYSVNPDLADNPEHRNQEFEALIARTHKAGLKVIIDIVPNHVARVYQGENNPPGVRDFGADDDTSFTYHRDNNFYYLPGEYFSVPDELSAHPPLGGEAHPALEKAYVEYPAKWTGNGSRLAQPNADDWYETVKINYGVRPDGSHDFASLPPHYRHLDCGEHLHFWQSQNVPDSWAKFRDIALYWLDKGVDGFRFDMAEMVPVEFWSYLNAHIKHTNADAIVIAEVYQPDRYRDYIQLGKMDYLYDKVDLYDHLIKVTQGCASTSEIGRIEYQLRDIEHHMLKFMENHDEQRLASPECCASGENAIPAMLVSACLSSAPTMIYFGQEVAEPGAEMAGYGQPSRTSIFDYVGVPHHQRWMNNGQFDGGQLTEQERTLRHFYQRLLNLSLNSPALCGDYHDLYADNHLAFGDGADYLYAFARSCSTQTLIIATNFSQTQSHEVTLTLNEALIAQWQLTEGTYALTNCLSGDTHQLQVKNGIGQATLNFTPLCAFYLELGETL